MSWTTEAFAATGWRVGWLIGPPSIIQPTLAASTRIVFCTNSPLQEAAASGLEQAKRRRYFEIQLAEYVERRAVLTDAFDKLGMRYTLPEGSYFILLVSNELQISDFFTLLTRFSRISPTSNFPMTSPSRKVSRAEVGILGVFRMLGISYTWLLISILRACWFIALEIGVSSIPVSEVSNTLDTLFVKIFSKLVIQFYCEEHANIGESYARFAFCKDLDTLRKAAERLQGLKKYLQ
jgi:kynurenine aminotransferase